MPSLACLIANEQENWMMFMKCWCYYTKQQESVEKNLCTPRPNECGVCKSQQWRCDLPTYSDREIDQAQKLDASLKKQKDMYSSTLVENTEVLCKDGKMVIPAALQHCAVSWYHHYLQHPGHTRHEETLHTAMYLKGMRCTIHKHVKNWSICQVNKQHNSI